MLQANEIQSLFFLGIGGIGMSALARYFHHLGFPVGGYDRTISPLTRELEAEGITIVYDGSLYTPDPSSLRNNHSGRSSIPDGKEGEAACGRDGAACGRDGMEETWQSKFSFEISPRTTLVVLTPAVPATTPIRQYFEENGFDIRKRSEVLGMVTQRMKALCVAGTHGKTTTSTLLAHIMYQSEIGTNAFLGGISENYQTNLLLMPSSSYVVVEADEYDRSFHRLQPYMSVITAVDPDHLDIYGTPEAYTEAFEHYTSLITGALVIKAGLEMTPRVKKGVKVYTYGVLDKQQVTTVCDRDKGTVCDRDKGTVCDRDEGTVCDRDNGKQQVTIDKPDFYADNIVVENGNLYFDFHAPSETIAHMRLGVPVWVNIENSVAAMAVAWLNGVSATELRVGLDSFAGVYRRFNMHVHTPKICYIDDYAHHPQELKASIESVKRLYPERKTIGIFQPHLFTRTRDFADEFAAVLSELDEVILLPIYPARELPIPGVDSQMLLERITANEKYLVEKAELVDFLKTRIPDEPVSVISLGAGDIDRLVPEITQALK